MRILDCHEVCNQGKGLKVVAVCIALMHTGTSYVSTLLVLESMGLSLMFCTWKCLISHNFIRTRTESADRKEQAIVDGTEAGKKTL